MFGADNAMKIWKAGYCTTEGHKLGKQLCPSFPHPPFLQQSHRAKTQFSFHKCLRCLKGQTHTTAPTLELLCKASIQNTRVTSTKAAIKILTVLGEVLAHGKAKVPPSLCFPPFHPPITPAEELCSDWGGPASTRKHCVHVSSTRVNNTMPPESYTRKVLLMNSIQLWGEFLSLQ